MTEENKTQPEEKKKIEAKPLPVDKEKARQIEQGLASPDAKVEEKKEPAKESKEEDKKSEVKEEKKTDEKKKDSKKKEIVKVKKELAIARGASLPISKKHSMYICNFIKNKDIDTAIKELEQVVKLKRAIPYKGEIPHRKGDMMSGRYPVSASKHFINLLKALKGNAIVNGLEIEKTRIVSGSPSWARRPMKSGGRAAKRTNIILTAKEVNKEKKK